MKNVKRINELVFFGRLAKYLHRLVFCSEKLNNDNKFCFYDIASDHGYIGYELLKNGVADNVVFSDISEKSLEKAMSLIQNSEFLQFSEFRIGDGLDVIDGEVFASVIAGIGGREIVKILGNKKLKQSKFYILQTSQDDVFLRRELDKLGLMILCDKCMIDNGHVYHTFLVSHCNLKIENERIDIEVLNYFKDVGLIKEGIDDYLINQYLSFKSDYYGKNNLFANDDNHIKCIEFQINRYKELLNSIVVNASKIEKNRGELSDSLGNYIKELKLRLDVLDKIYVSIL